MFQVAQSSKKMSSLVCMQWLPRIVTGNKQPVVCGLTSDNSGCSCIAMRLRIEPTPLRYPLNAVAAATTLVYASIEMFQVISKWLQSTSPALIENNVPCFPVGSMLMVTVPQKCDGNLCSAYQIVSQPLEFNGGKVAVAGSSL